MGDKALTTWVSDQLHGILGYSQGYLADFVVSLAKQERSAQALLNKLGEADVPDTPASRKFATELFSRAPRSGASGLTTSEQSRREAVSLLKQNDKYGMVSDGDDDEEDEVTVAVQRALQEKERERKRAEKEEKKNLKKRSRAEEKEKEKPAASSSVDDAEREREEVTHPR